MLLPATQIPADGGRIRLVTTYSPVHASWVGPENKASGYNIA